MPSPSVLILYSNTGGGHRAAATALEQAIHQLTPSVTVSTLDPILDDESSAPIVRRLAGLYSPLIRRSPRTWGAIYHSCNNRPAFALVRGVFAPAVRSRIIDALQEHDPDLVISVHPLLNHVAWQAIQRSGRRRGLAVVVTDLVDFHLGWMFKRADVIFVPTAAAKGECLKAGVPEDRLHLLGLPVDLRFRPPAPGERAAIRRRYGLAESLFTILVSGGGEGSGPLLEQVAALARRDGGDWQQIIVCGRNEKLRRRLSRLDFQGRALILGFVDNMPDLLRASDLAVGKAGPGMIAEALATGVPILLTSYLPGQETQNVSFVVDSGLGRYTPKPRQLREAVAELAQAGDEYQRMVARAADVSRPYASLDIARECLLLAMRHMASVQASL